MEETVIPLQTAHGGGFEQKRVCQFVVFLENRVGRLRKLVQIFEDSTAKIVALSVEESSEAALVRLICSDSKVAKSVLEDNGFAFGQTDLIAVELPQNTTSPLLAICNALLQAEINIHSAYPLLVAPKNPTIALYLDEPTFAAEILVRKGFILIGESDLSL